MPQSRWAASLKRNVWIILLVVAAGAGVGYVKAGHEPILYDADAKVWINQDQSRAPGPGEARPPLLNSSSWLGLLRSYSVVDPVVRQLLLNVTFVSGSRDSVLFRSFNQDSTFSPVGGGFRLTVDSAGKSWRLTRGSRSPVPTDSGRAGEPIGRKFGLVWAPPAGMIAQKRGRVVEFVVGSPRSAAKNLVTHLRVYQPDQGNQLMYLVYTGAHREYVAPTLNAWLRQFVEVAGALKRRHAEATDAHLNEELLRAELAVRTSELELQKYRVRTLTALLDQPASRQAAPVQTAEEGRLIRAVAASDAASRARHQAAARDNAAPPVAVQDTAEAPLTPNATNGPWTFFLCILAALVVGLSIALLRDSIGGEDLLGATA